MLKDGLLLAVLITSIRVLAQDNYECLGFQPEVKLACHVGKDVYQVHAFEEKRCGEGRDGILNDKDPVQKVEGPYWTDTEELATVEFKYQGEDVTLKNCELLEVASE
jgi:hypothetical protein